MIYKLNSNVFDQNLKIKKVENTLRSLDEINEGYGIGIVTKIHRTGHFSVKFENKDLEVMYSKSGLRYDRETLKGPTSPRLCLFETLFKF